MTAISTKAHGSHPGSPAPHAAYPALRWLTMATFVVILNETLMVNAIPG